MTKTELIKEIENIVDKYIERIGTMGNSDYNKNLDCICCDLLDLKFKYELGWLDE